MARTTHIFAEIEVDSFLRADLEEMKQTIEAEKEDYLLSVNESEYVAHLLDRYRLEAPSLDFENIEVTEHEAEVLRYRLSRSPDGLWFGLAPRTSETRSSTTCRSRELRTSCD